MSHMSTTIGVRELRRDASRYLERVEAGETIDVSNRGRVVAHLVPVRSDPWEDMIAAGLVLPPEDPTVDVLAPPLPPVTEGPTASAILAAMREHER